jgi:hypothetical protein
MPPTSSQERHTPTWCYPHVAAAATRLRRQRHKPQSWHPPFRFVGYSLPSTPISISWQHSSLCPADVLLLTLNSGCAPSSLAMTALLLRRPLLLRVFMNLCSVPRERLMATDSRSGGSPPAETVGFLCSLTR